MALNGTRTLRGALAGVAGIAVWTAQQPLDKRVFGVDYDDVELLGKFVTREPAWLPIGMAMHVFNGAAFPPIDATNERVGSARIETALATSIGAVRGEGVARLVRI